MPIEKVEAGLMNGDYFDRGRAADLAFFKNGRGRFVERLKSCPFTKMTLAKRC